MSGLAEPISLSSNEIKIGTTKLTVKRDSLLLDPNGKCLRVALRVLDSKGATVGQIECTEPRRAMFFRPRGKIGALAPRTQRELAAALVQRFFA